MKKNEIIFDSLSLFFFLKSFKFFLFIFLVYFMIVYLFIFQYIHSLNSFYFFYFSKKHGSTPLHKAVLKGQEQVVKILLEKGANIEALNEVFLFISKMKNRNENIFIYLFLKVI